MEEFIKKIWHTAKETATNGLETARSTGLPRKIILVLLGVASCIIVVILFMKALGYLFDSIYSFVNRHFYGVAATAAGGSCIALQYYKKKEERERKMAELQRGSDAQKERFCKGCYQTIGNWLYSGIFSAPNFSALTSCQRPLRPADMGNPTLDAYTYRGMMYHRYMIPKVDTENLDTSLIRYAVQGLIDQHIRTNGLPPLIERSENNMLYVDKAEDMKTYVTLTLVLSFDDSYIQRVAYENAMTEVLNQTYGSRTLQDNDYHG